MTNTDAAAASPTTTAAAAPATDNTAATATTTAAPATATTAAAITATPATCTASATTPHATSSTTATSASATKFSISAITDAIVKIITALVIARCWYIGWASDWVVEAPHSYLIQTLFVMFYTALALHTRRIYPQVILGLIWFTVFSSYSIFADKIIFNYNERGYAIGFCLLMMLLSIPAILSVSCCGISDINKILRSAFDFRTPRRDALFPYFCLFIILFISFLMLFPTLSLFFTCLASPYSFFILSALWLLPLPAALLRRLKTWHAAAPTPPQAPKNCKTDTLPQTTRLSLWRRSQPCFRLAIVILCILAMLVPEFKSGEALLTTCLIIGVCAELIFFYKQKKTILPPQTQTAKQPFGNASANNIAQPVSTNSTSANSPHPNAPQNFDTPKNSAPLLPTQQSLLQRSSRCWNFFLHTIGFIILFIIYTIASINITTYGFELKYGDMCIGNCYSPTVVERRF